MRNALLVVVAAAVVGILAVLVDRRVLQPRREADQLVASARPYASSSHEGALLTAESLLAQAELRQRDRADVLALRAQIAATRTMLQQKDEQILAAALATCLAGIEKVGYVADAQRVRALTALSKRDQYVECMKVTLLHLNEGLPVPSASASVK